MNSTRNAPNYLGLVGVVLTTIGMFMPCIDLWIVEYSLTEYLSGLNQALVWFVFILLAVTAICFFLGKNNARWIGLGILTLLLWLIYRGLSAEFRGRDLYDIAGTDVLGSGFWLVLFALILTVASPNLTDLLATKEKHSVGEYETSARQKKIAVNSISQNSWTCPNCKNINYKTTEICFVCGIKRFEQICPSCGKTIRAGGAFCGNCGVNLEEARKNAEERAARKKKYRDVSTISCPGCGKDSPREMAFCGNCGLDIRDFFEKSKDAHIGVWKEEVDSNNAPRQMLTIISIENNVLTFDLERYATYQIKEQSVILDPNGIAHFHATDGSNIAGIIYLNIDYITILVKDPGTAPLKADDIYIFTKDDDR